MGFVFLFELHNEMWTVIDKLIEDSFQQDNFEDVMNCIKHMRSQCVVEEEPIIFNNSKNYQTSCFFFLYRK